MDIKDFLGAVENHTKVVVEHVSTAVGVTNALIERTDAKVDAAVTHIVSSKRTLLWILCIVLADFIAGLWIGGKLF